MVNMAKAIDTHLLVKMLLYDAGGSAGQHQKIMRTAINLRILILK